MQIVFRVLRCLAAAALGIKAASFSRTLRFSKGKEKRYSGKPDRAFANACYILACAVPFGFAQGTASTRGNAHIQPQQSQNLPPKVNK